MPWRCLSCCRCTFYYRPIDNTHLLRIHYFFLQWNRNMYKIITQPNTTDMSFSPKNSQRLFQKHDSLPKMNGDPSVYNNLVDGSITPSTVPNNTFCCSVVHLGLILKLGRSIQNWRGLHWRSTRDNSDWGEIKLLYTHKKLVAHVLLEVKGWSDVMVLLWLLTQCVIAGVCHCDHLQFWDLCRNNHWHYMKI